MNKLVAGSRSKGGFNFSSTGKHGLENARVMVRCDEGSVMVDVYALRGDIYIDLWLNGENSDRPIENLLFSGKFSKLLECDGLYWQPELLERVFSDAIKLREEAEVYETV